MDERAVPPSETPDKPRLARRSLRLAIVATLVALLARLTTARAQDSVRDEVTLRLRVTTNMSASLLAEQMAEQMASYVTLAEAQAKRARLAWVVAGGPARSDRAEITRELEALQAARQRIAATALLDLDGILPDSPVAQELVGTDFSERDYYRGLRARGDTYVSEAFGSAQSGHPLIVTVATYVRAAGRPRAILLLSARLDGVRGPAPRHRLRRPGRDPRHRAGHRDPAGADRQLRHLPAAAAAAAPVAGRGGAGRGPRRLPAQDRVPLPDQPRAAHPAQRHPRVRAADAARGAHRGAARQRRADPPRRPPPAGADQRDPRHLPDRDRQPGPVGGGGRPPGGGHRDQRPDPAPGRRAGDPAPGPVGRGVPLDRPRRPPAAQAGAAEPDLQRRQVQPPRRQHHHRLPSQGQGPGRDRRPGHRPGHPGRQDGAAVHALRPPGGRADRRAGHRPGPGPVPGPDGGDGRHPQRHQRGRRGEHTILYVEDNPSSLRLVERVLARRGGVRLLTASEGELVEELVRECRPDLILLDLHLPGIDGEEMLRRLRADQRTADVPVVMVSADVTPWHRERLLEAGAVEYLTKPLDVPRFLDVIDGILVAAHP